MSLRRDESVMVTGRRVSNSLIVATTAGAAL
jgi:hypothetical protein